jgi:hypothetical protein
MLNLKTDKMKNYRFTSTRKNSQITFKDFVRGLNVKNAIKNFKVDSNSSTIIKIELI